MPTMRTTFPPTRPRVQGYAPSSLTWSLRRRCRGARLRRLLHVGVALTALIAIGVNDTAVAGPYTDALATCLIKSATHGDRSLLMKWVFSAMALQPDVSALATISTQQRREINKSTGALIQRLIGTSCRVETQQAMKNEGPQTLTRAFTTLSQLAADDLFSNPRVVDGMAGLADAMNAETMKAVRDAVSATK